MFSVLFILTGKLIYTSTETEAAWFPCMIIAGWGGVIPFPLQSKSQYVYVIPDSPKIFYDGTWYSTKTGASDGIYASKDAGLCFVTISLPSNIATNAAGKTLIANISYMVKV